MSKFDIKLDYRDYLKRLNNFNKNLRKEFSPIVRPVINKLYTSLTATLMSGGFDSGKIKKLVSKSMYKSGIGGLVRYNWYAMWQSLGTNNRETSKGFNRGKIQAKYYFDNTFDSQRQALENELERNVQLKLKNRIM